MLSPVHTSNNVDASFDFVATNGNNVERFCCKNCVLSANEHVNFLRLCRKDEISFDIVGETGNIVAKNGNNVEARVDFVRKDEILQ